MATERSLDEKYMKLALRLARRGPGRTSPNPMVGAVIVKDDRIIGQGYHRFFGGAHAEVNAIENASENVTGSTMYVTLEPCCHYGKTPPCVDAIVENKIGKVVIGTLDPYPEMRGRSLELLKQQGIETRVGVLEEECRSLNEVYLKYTATGIPFVTVKFAQSLDGRISASSGDSRWISSPPSLRLAHRLRSYHDAVMVGVGTVLADNPQLTVRLVRGRNPKRIVLDSRLRVPLDAAVLSSQESAPTLIATTPAADDRKVKSLHRLGIEVLKIPPDAAGRVDIAELLKALAQRQISSVLVEGGAETITSFLLQGLADRLVAIVAPKILGKGTASVGDLNIADISKALKLDFIKTYRSGDDLVIEAKINRE